MGEVKASASQAHKGTKKKGVVKASVGKDHDKDNATSYIKKADKYLKANPDEAKHVWKMLERGTFPFQRAAPFSIKTVTC